MKTLISKILNSVNKLNKSISRKAQIGINVKIQELSCIDSNCIIGSYTYIGKNCNITKSSIGSYCSIANNVSIGQGEHHLERISTSSLFYEDSYDELTHQLCTIESDVWIGTDSVILRGVKLGVGSVVGANSVVTIDVPAFAVVVGSPAKVIKYRFDNSKIEKILESKWWIHDIDRAKEIIEELV